MTMKRTYYAITLLLSVVALTACRHDKPAATPQPVKVVTLKAAATTADGRRGFSGTVEESDGTSLSFSTAGTISRMYVGEGQTVAQGALLAEVDPTTAQNAYDAALAMRQQAEDAYARMKQLHDNGSLPEIQWVEVQSKLRQAVSAEQIARKGLADCRLYAPFGGYVAHRAADAGENVMPGAPVLKLVRIDRVKVKIAVPEGEIAAMKPGDAVEVEVQALGGRRFAGRVAEKGVEANPLSRSYDVKVLVDNPRHELLPGMVCSAYAGRAAGGRTITLPAGVVRLDSDNHTFVWLCRDGRAEKRAVTVGETTAAGVVIADGLTEGDEVITEGGQKVSEGTRVTR